MFSAESGSVLTPFMPSIGINFDRSSTVWRPF
jgi:hypothetical protein